jgi:xylulokinase
LVFLPYLTGERCPHADPHAKGAYIGLTPRHTMAHMVRATMEGITYGMREQIEIFRSMNIAVNQVRASGGGARSDLWRQMQADMYQAPVVTINVAEGAALGVAILAGVGAGEWASVPQACKAIIKVKLTSKPKPKAAAFYSQQYPRYGTLYPTLKNWFAKTTG